MTKNQFYYTRKEVEKSKDPESSAMEIVEYIDSFSLDLVTRTLALADGRRIVLLNDFHEEIVERPITNKRGEVIRYEKRKEIVHSEIYLEPNDAETYMKLTNVEE